MPERQEKLFEKTRSNKYSPVKKTNDRIESEAIKDLSEHIGSKKLFSDEGRNPIKKAKRTVKKAKNSKENEVIISKTVYNIGMKLGDPVLKKHLSLNKQMIKQMDNEQDVKETINNLFHYNHDVQLKKRSKIDVLISAISLGKKISKEYGLEYLLDYPELRIITHLYDFFGKKNSDGMHQTEEI